MFIVPDNQQKVQPGQKFALLTVLGKSFYLCDKSSRKHKQWCVAECECGNATLTLVYDLVRGKKKGCGCSKARIAFSKKRIHGDSNTRLFGIWKHIKARCLNRNNKNFGRYGGRGIEVCDTWKDEFIPFRDWAIRNGYRDDLEIDRIDNDGNYEPENCRWSSRSQQCNNKSNNRLLTAFGKSMTVQQWLSADECKVKKGTLWRRLYAGWSDERALSELPKPSPRWRR